MSRVQEAGISLNLDRVRPATPDPADAAAALRAETQRNLMWTDPLLTGRYAPGETDTFGELIERQDFRREGDLALVSAPMDFLGLNYYTPSTVRAAPWREPDPALRTAMDNRFEGVAHPGVRHTAMGWAVVPDALRDLLVSLRDRYGPLLPPIHITENGSAEHDAPAADGTVCDADRIAYLEGHLRAVSAAISASSTR